MMLHPKSYMPIIILLMVSLSLTFNSCISSKEKAGASAGVKTNNYCELKKFTGKYIDGKIYLNWVINTNVPNYYFVLEKSRDCAKTFITVQIIKGHPSPLSQGLLFSFTDSNLISTSRTYRLKMVEPVKNGSELLLYVDGKNLLENYKNAMINVDNNDNVASR